MHNMYTRTSLMYTLRVARAQDPMAGGCTLQLERVTLWLGHTLWDLLSGMGQQLCSWSAFQLPCNRGNTITA